jgi:bifunctional DNA-binding transcriptional regulator/antitoxin component of YhaV-PrlF toxin-antitoxin module
MTEHAKIGPGGEAAIPGELCEKLNLRPGMDIEIDLVAGQLVVRSPAKPRERISWEEFRRRMPKYEGPVISIEEMNQAIEEERARRWARKERDSR